MTKTKPTAPTLKAVLAEVDRLLTKAQRVMAQDPYARPFYPSTYNAKRECQKLTKQAREQLIADGVPPAEAAAQADRVGPAKTLAWLRARETFHDREIRRQVEEAERTVKRHRRRQMEAKRNREATRRGLDLGQRINAGLAALSVVGTPKAATLDGDVVTGSRAAPEPQWQGDPAHRARKKALEAVEFVENEVENARRRRVEESHVA